jgi:hypothetical protein
LASGGGSYDMTTLPVLGAPSCSGFGRQAGA